MTFIRAIFPKPHIVVNMRLSVIFRFLLCAIHRLLTAHLYLKQPLSNKAATLYRFNQSVLVWNTSLSLLFTYSLPDIRRPLQRCF